MNDRTLGHYEISSKLGEGGMGEVYRARDTKLDRDVALKFLSREVAQDPERLARFRREAKVLASLNHPHIAGLYGLEEAEGKIFLVMELAEGEDLAARLRHGRLPVSEVVEIAAQIAEGLEEAHEKGIVHRDLKPANVMVAGDGRVKILDFGLARAFTGDSVDEGDLANSPTITAAMTQMGTILGTAAYMSPEQAKGRTVDRRADIWSFGVILYEMLTGDAPFAAETVSETVAAVLMRPVDLSNLPDDVPAPLRALMQRCLERDPRKRLRDIGEARIYLQDPAAATVLSASMPPGMAAAATTPPVGRRAWLPWTLVGVLVVALMVAMALGGPGPQGPAPPEVVFSSLEGPGDTGFHLSGTGPAPASFSPDGTQVVYGVRSASASPELWLQELSSPEPRRLSGTTGAAYEFWSPDGKSIGFFAGGSLNVMDLATESRRQLAIAANGKGGCWSRNGEVLFASTAESPISKLDLATGEVTEITDLEADPPADSHRHPRMLTADTFLFVARLTDPGSGPPVAIMVGHLDGSPSTELARAESQAEFSDGHLLYLSEANLIARPLDPAALEFTGAPVTIATDVGRIPGAALGLFSVSNDGNLVFHPGYSATLTAKLAWFDDAGERQGEATELEAIGNFDVSPDMTTAAVEVWGDRSGRSDLWLYEFDSRVATRLTFDAGTERTPQWSPDGKTLYYVGGEASSNTVMALDPDSRSAPREVFTMPGLGLLDDVSPDGSYLSVDAVDSATGNRQVFVVPVDGSSPPIPVDESAGSALNGHFSPDGRWIAYALEDNGSFRLYLKTNPPTSRKWQITDQDAYWYDWAPTGDQIFFQGGGSELFVTEIDLSGDVPRVGRTRVQLEGFPIPVTNLHDFSVGSDGRTFYVSDAGATDDSRPLRLVLHWPRLLERDSGAVPAP